MRCLPPRRASRTPDNSMLDRHHRHGVEVSPHCARRGFRMSNLPVAELELDPNESGVDLDLELDGQPESNSATVAAPTEPVCEKCQTPFKGSQEWCKRCGWYPRLRTHVELDPWEREDL